MATTAEQTNGVAAPKIHYGGHDRFDLELEVSKIGDPNLLGHNFTSDLMVRTL